MTSAGPRSAAPEATLLTVSHSRTRVRVPRGMETTSPHSTFGSGVVASGPQIADTQASRSRRTEPATRRDRGGLRGSLLLAAATLLAGCGTSAPVASPSPTTTPTSTPTAAARDQAVLSAYRAATAAFVHAETAMDPNDPALLATMTGEELSTVKKNLIVDRASGLVARGDIRLSDPHIVSFDGQQAVVRDCQQSALLLYDAKTGGAAPGVANGPQNIAVTTTLVIVDGIWKMALQDGRVGTCPLGY